ncbi:serine hydrolase domain-containing protein [Candidatus Latescibacterota bacterium]
MNGQEKAAAILEKMIHESATPGVQYLFMDAGSILFEFNGGKSNIETKTKLTHATTFNAFSVTKTLTALAILQLAENRKLNIDDPVRKYVSLFPYETDFSIRHVLNHTSGLPNPMPLKWVHLRNEHELFNYKEFIENVLKKNDTLISRPGEKYSYSNIGYLILGEIIEKTSGIDYRNYINSHILEKLSFSKNAYLGFEIPLSGDHAHGYIKKWSFLTLILGLMFDKRKFVGNSYDGWSQFKYFYNNGYSYGGLIGNARGFGHYLQTFLQGNVLIRNESKSALFKIQTLNNGASIDMGLSWFFGRLDKDVFFAHSGGGGGYYCEIRLYIEKKMASVIMFNRTGLRDERILDKIDKYFL